MKYLNLLAFAFMITMNYLANALPLGGKTTGQLSDQYPNLFTPAGITFSIWGIIYLLILVFIIVQLKADSQKLVSSIGWAFIISALLNGLWIVAWHYERTGLSVLIMLGLLASLIYINQQLSGMPFSITKLTFGIYLGWICIATIANVTTLLVSINWGGFGISAEVWTILLIAVGAAVTIITMYRLHNSYLALAVIWAFAGIIIKRQADYQSIVIAAVAGILLVALFAVLMFFRKTA
ncbi:MAG: tryptophan-rich sensory protein [Bacteroidales bacterium]|nr:tryptophan-rich sensory protein [Bacteroidales bacterium]